MSKEPNALFRVRFRPLIELVMRLEGARLLFSNRVCSCGVPGRAAILWLLRLLLLLRMSPRLSREGRGVAVAVLGHSLRLIHKFHSKVLCAQKLRQQKKQSWPRVYFREGDDVMHEAAQSSTALLVREDSWLQFSGGARITTRG